MVDPSPIRRRILSQALGPGVSCFVLQATNLAQALKLLDPVPDLVLTELSLGDSDSLELIRAVRSQSPATPIIVITAQNNSEAVNQAREAGATQYILQPVTPAQLSRRLKTLASVTG